MADTATASKQADRAAFEAAASKQAPVGAPITPTSEPKQSPPEVMWAEGKAYSKSKDEQAAAIAAKKPAVPVKADVPRGTSDRTAEESTHTDEDDLEPERAALRSLGFRKKHLDTMDADEIRSRGSKAIRRVEADAEAHRIAKEWREAQKAVKASEKTPADSQPQKSQLAKPDISHLKETLGLNDAGAKTLSEYIENQALSASEMTAAQLRDQLKQEREAHTADVRAEILKGYQAELGKSIPEMLDPDTFPEIEKEAREIGGSAKYARIKNPRERDLTVLKDAAINLGYGSDESDSKSEERTSRNDARSTISERAPRIVGNPDRVAFDASMAKAGR